MTASILDRLADLTPGTDDSAAPFYERKSYLWESLLADLTRLLNTRHGSHQSMAGLPLARVSVANYGLPDFGAHWQSGAFRQELAAVMAECLRRFEPRLENPEVTPVEHLSPGLAAHFRVGASLCGSEERVRFEALAPAGSTQFQIVKENR